MNNSSSSTTMQEIEQKDPDSEFPTCDKLQLSQRDREEISQLINRWVQSKRFVSDQDSVDPKRWMVEYIMNFLNQECTINKLLFIGFEDDYKIVEDVIFELSN